MDSEERCTEDVGSGIFLHRCNNRGKYRHEGQRYCGIHHPLKVREREARLSEYYQAESSRKDNIRQKNKKIFELKENIVVAAVFWFYNPGAGEQGDLFKVVNELEDLKKSIQDTGEAYGLRF